MKVSVGLDFATFLRQIDQNRLALTVLKTVFSEAQSSMGTLDDVGQQMVAPVLQRCRDLMSTWSLEPLPEDADDDVEDELDDDDDEEGEHESSTASGGTDSKHKRAPAATGSSSGKSRVRQPSNGSARKPASLPFASAFSPKSRASHSPMAVRVTAAAAAAAARKDPMPVVINMDPYLAPSPYHMLGLLKDMTSPRVNEGATANSSSATNDGGGDNTTAAQLVLQGSAGSVTVSQVEVLLSVMPPANEVIDASSLRDSVTVVPSLHELFHFYTVGEAVSGARRDGMNVVYGKESMDIKAFVNKSSAGGPTIPEHDFRRMLHDFGITPKLVSFHVSASCVACVVCAWGSSFRVRASVSLHRVFVPNPRPCANACRTYPLCLRWSTWVRHLC